MSQITSRVKVQVDGDELLNRSGWTFNPGGLARTSQSGDQGVHGFTEAYNPSSASGDVSHTKAMDLVETAKLDNVTLLVETNSGQSYVVRGAWLTDLPSLNAGEGSVTLTFEGPPAERM